MYAWVLVVLYRLSRPWFFYCSTLTTLRDRFPPTRRSGLLPCCLSSLSFGFVFGRLVPLHCSDVFSRVWQCVISFACPFALSFLSVIQNGYSPPLLLVFFFVHSQKSKVFAWYRFDFVPRVSCSSSTRSGEEDSIPELLSFFKVSTFFLRGSPSSLFSVSSLVSSSLRTHPLTGTVQQVSACLLLLLLLWVLSSPLLGQFDSPTTRGGRRPAC